MSVFKTICSKIKDILPLLLFVCVISCKKETEVIENNKPIGEQTYQIGSYQTIPVRIESGIDKGFVIAGTASNNENGEYPFLISINDSLQQQFIVNPAFNEIQTTAVDLVRLTDGYAILSNSSVNDLGTNGGVRLTKISFSGKIIWEKKYFSGVISFGPVISADKDNSIIVACHRSLPPYYTFYSIIARIDSEGNLLWSFDIYPEVLNQPETIITDNQDNYIAIVDSITDCHTCEQDRVSIPVVLKINKDGQILWKKRLESDNGLAWSSVATTDSNNDIIIAHEPGVQDGSFYHNKKVVLKLDSSGKILWQTFLTKEMFKWPTNNLGFEEMREIAVDSENNIYIVGNINEDRFFGPRRLATAKLSASGEVLKTNVYPGNTEYQGISIKRVTDDKFIVLSWKYFPYEIAVCYINSELRML